MPPDQPLGNHEEIKRILLENQRLLIENNRMLYRMRRSAALSGILRFLWIVSIVLSIAYFYLVYIKPNLGVIEEKFRSLENFTTESAKLRDWYNNTIPGGFTGQ